MYSDEDSDGGGNAQRLHNQPFDEAYDVNDPEEIASNLAVTPIPGPRAGRHQRQSSKPSPLSGGMERGDSPPQPYSDEDDDDYDDLEDGEHFPHPGEEFQGGDESHGQSFDDGDDLSQSRGSSESLSSSGDEHVLPPMEGAYDPAEFENLDVSTEIKELFSYITVYKPQLQELDTKLSPFIPDYIPAVGDIDAFIKVGRPDRQDTGLGLEIVDEPCAGQSDPTVLDLHLRNISKTASSQTVAIKTVKDAENNTKAVDSWISSITELHRTKPPQNVHYSNPMPSIDTLMQEWPSKFEDLLRQAELPTGDLDVSLGQFVDIVSALVDIPVHDSRIQALHLLFTLYVEFKNSQHFKFAGADEEPLQSNQPETMSFD